MDLKSIYFPVQKVPVNDIMPGYKHPSGISNAVVLDLPNGEKYVANYCSDIYFLVKNQDVMDPFMKELTKFWKVETSVINRGNTQFHVDFIMKDYNVAIFKGDDIFPKIRLSNSYDGKVKYHFTLGFHRLVCTNGLSAPVGEGVKIKKLHTPSLDELTSFESVVEMVNGFVNNREALSEVFFELNEHKVFNLQDRVEEILEETRFPVSFGEDVLARAQEEMVTLGMKAPTDWLVYNAFNYQLNHNEDYKAKEIKKEEIDSEIQKYLLDY